MNRSFKSEWWIANMSSWHTIFGIVIYFKLSWSNHIKLISIKIGKNHWHIFLMNFHVGSPKCGIYFFLLSKSILFTYFSCFLVYFSTFLIYSSILCLLSWSKCISTFFGYISIFLLYLSTFLVNFLLLLFELRCSDYLTALYKSSTSSSSLSINLIYINFELQ